VPPGLGPRFLVEAGFIIAVAAVAGVERFRTVTIIVVVGAAWAIVAVIELVLELRRRARRRAGWEREPEPEREPVSEPVLVAEPEAEVAEAPPEAVQTEPAPAAPRILAAVTEPPPAPPEPASEPEPAAAPTVLSLESRRSGPREWNVWDLERIAREQAGDDVARNEERAYLLMYLREFANADGILPADFDGVVRETFGDVLDAAYTS
jgi:type IV secretory pathway VirB10-like protein